jgi:putative hemolysin
MISNPFRFEPPFKTPLIRAIAKPLIRLLEELIGLGSLSRKYDLLDSNLRGGEFVEDTFKKFDIHYDITGGSLDNIPKEGPVVAIANHPFGGIEGMALIDILARVRPDSKVLVNEMLHRIEPLRDSFIGVNTFETDNAKKKNVGGVRETYAWVSEGHALGVFPGGTVSHLQLDRREISDPEWNRSVPKMITRSKAVTIPIFFEGTNGVFFHLLGLIHPLLRTLMLPRELVNKCGKRFKVRIGKPIPYERLSQFRNDEEILAYLRFRTYVLSSSATDSTLEIITRKLFGKRILTRARKVDPIIKEIPSEILAKEVAKLSNENLLVSQDDFDVYYARKYQIPNILREIGRLREITFRDVEEGTGKEIDLDRFDNYYSHLFVWNREKKEIASAYRLGQTDRIIKRFGTKGLYTNTLFHYDPKLLEQINPALEVGRSFVRKEYQKNYLSLLLLWKGIGHYVVRFPKYQRLFGPVSLSSDYDPLSRSLIIEFLKENSFDNELASLIRARNPMKSSPVRGVGSDAASVVVRDVKEVSDLLSEIESTQTNVPVMLRQYLKLGGKLLGFNVDKDFGEVLDGLLLVDLVETDERILERYLGKEGTKEFLKFHSVPESTIPSPIVSSGNNE